MIFYVAIVALVNLGLGYGLAKYLGAHGAQPGSLTDANHGHAEDSADAYEYAEA